MRYHFVSAVSSAAMAAAAMTFATSAFAQDGDAGSMATGQPLALQGAALDDIVVTARRRDERLQDVPVSVVAFSGRSEEHTSELQSLMRISYAVFCLKKKKRIH